MVENVLLGQVTLGRDTGAMLMEQYYYGYPLGRAYIVYELDELETLKPTGRLFRMMSDEEAAEILMMESERK